MILTKNGVRIIFGGNYIFPKDPKEENGDYEIMMRIDDYGNLTDVNIADYYIIHESKIDDFVHQKIKETQTGRPNEYMKNKLTDKELKALKSYVRNCEDLMNHVSVSPRIFSILLDNYEENQK